MGMGYQGYAKFYVDEHGGNVSGEEKSVVVLTTGASVNLVLEPIYSTGVWGAGWYNAAESAHYADNAIRYEGNIDTELQVGTLGKYWNLIQDFAIAHRAYPKSLEISPDGAHVYKYLIKAKDDDNNNVTINSPESFKRDSENYTHGAYCSSINFSTSAGNVVTSSVGIVAIYRDESDPAGGLNYPEYSYINQIRGVVGSDTTLVKEMSPLNPGATNVNPIPYWRTNAKLFCSRDKGKAEEGPTSIAELFNIGKASDSYMPQDDVETVEWNIDVSNNQQILYTCCGTRMPRAVLMGPMSVTGAVTLFSDQGVYDPVLGPDPANHPHDVKNQYMAAENTWFNVAIEADNGRYVYIAVPAVVVESDDYSIQSADSVTNRAFNIKGLGGRCINGDTYLGSFVLPPCVMSRYYTAQNPTSADILAVPWSYDSTTSSYSASPEGYEAAPSSSGD